MARKRRIKVALVPQKNRPRKDGSDAGYRPWQMRWTDPETGKVVWRTTGTRNGDEAESIRAETERLVNDGTYIDQVGWQAFRRRYRDEHLATLRPRSIEKAEWVLDTFEQWAKPKLLEDVTANSLSRWRQALHGREFSPWTIRGYIKAFLAALHWAQRSGLINKVPEAPVCRVPTNRPKLVTIEDAEKLFNAESDPQWKALLGCAWYAGLRMNEALRLCGRPSNVNAWVDWERKQIVIPARAGKANRDDIIPLHKSLAELLKPLTADEDGRLLRIKSRQTGKHFGHEVTRAGAGTHVANLAKRAGVSIGMHDLRRGYLQRLALLVSAPVLQSLARHASITTTMEHYVSVDNALRGAMDLLEDSDTVALSVAPKKKGRVKAKAKST